jgi:hypothetical protein
VNGIRVSWRQKPTPQCRTATRSPRREAEPREAIAPRSRGRAQRGDRSEVARPSPARPSALGRLPTNRGARPSPVRPSLRGRRRNAPWVALTLVPTAAAADSAAIARGVVAEALVAATTLGCHGPLHLAQWMPSGRGGSSDWRRLSAGYRAPRAWPVSWPAAGRRPSVILLSRVPNVFSGYLAVALV